MGVVLVVEDDRSLRETVVYNLRSAGHEPIVAADGVTALEMAREASPDVILLDLLLPRMSGFDVLRALRREVSAPVIVLSALDSEADKVRALETGADDYVTKPFALREMMARVEAQMRRSQNDLTTPEVLVDGAIEVDRGRHEVRKHGRIVALSPKEFELLVYLMAHAGQLRSRDAILEAVWGLGYMGETRTVDVHVYGLRRKLEDDPASPKQLLTVRSYGYKWVPGDESPAAHPERREDPARTRRGGDP